VHQPLVRQGLDLHKVERLVGQLHVDAVVLVHGVGGDARHAHLQHQLLRLRLRQATRRALLAAADRRGEQRPCALECLLTSSVGGDHCARAGSRRDREKQ